MNRFGKKIKSVTNNYSNQIMSPCCRCNQHVTIVNIYFRYFTDVLNILQGVYIFLIFVCKKSVLNVIIGREVNDNELRTTEDDSCSEMEMDAVNPTYRQSISVCLS